jgi:hypothetical protein
MGHLLQPAGSLTRAKDFITVTGASVGPSLNTAVFSYFQSLVWIQDARWMVSLEIRRAVLVCSARFDDGLSTVNDTGYRTVSIMCKTDRLAATAQVTLAR